MMFSQVRVFGLVAGRAAFYNFLNFIQLSTNMESLYFTQELIPARAVALTELLETYEKYHPNTDTSDAYATKQAFRMLLEMFSDDEPKPDTSNFKVGYLVKFQNELIAKNYARSQVNRFFKLVKRVFVWGGASRFDHETWDKLPPIVSSTFVADLNTIKPIEIGKCRDNAPRMEVAAEDVEAVFPFVSEIVTDILRIQLLTGMRPSEVCKMRACDIKRTKAEYAEYSRLYDDENWLYVLDSHKTEKHIGVKAIPLGIEEQKILTKYLEGLNADSYVFRNSNGNMFSSNEYGRKIKKAIEKNDLPKFVPYQIRHSALTNISTEHGRDVARAVAGHTTEVMTARYDHSDLKKAFVVTRRRNQYYTEGNLYTKEKKAVGSADTNNNFPQLRIFRGDQ